MPEVMNGIVKVLGQTRIMKGIFPECGQGYGKQTFIVNPAGTSNRSERQEKGEYFLSLSQSWEWAIV